MSHFAVLVIGEDVEATLAPYQENNMEDCPEQYLEFQGVTEDETKNYETGTIEVVVGPDGDTYDAYDDRFLNKNHDSLLSDLKPDDLLTIVDCHI